VSTHSASGKGKGEQTDEEKGRANEKRSEDRITNVLGAATDKNVLEERISTRQGRKKKEERGLKKKREEQVEAS